MAVVVEEAPRLIGQAFLSVRAGPYGRDVTTKVEFFDDGAFLLTRLNGERVAIGEYRFTVDQARRLVAGESRLAGAVVRLDGPGDDMRREAWTEGETLLLLLMEPDGYRKDAFRLFADEIASFLRFVWTYLKAGVFVRVGKSS